MVAIVVVGLHRNHCICCGQEEDNDLNEHFPLRIHYPRFCRPPKPPHKEQSTAQSSGRLFDVMMRVGCLMFPLLEEGFGNRTPRRRRKISMFVRAERLDWKRNPAGNRPCVVFLVPRLPMTYGAIFLLKIPQTLMNGTF
mmetsp:Transcript_9706/g.22344  ORF Transcript_9706/g.22344 Transcript_9706/m.22344 type:complete len:139 (-) Transcript_9706:501-917(-)